MALKWKDLLILMTNKEASCKQEKMVADYMGWKVVSGSGSRPFAPGDVKNENYLVECKTHIAPQDNIIFYKKHWRKIITEAQATNRYPALVVDNGTQKSNNTWVAVLYHSLPDNTHVIQGATNKSHKDTAITFGKDELDTLYRLQYDDTKINYFIGWFGDDELAIMPLSEFQKYYREQFEC